MCHPCDILDNYCSAFPGDEPVILRKHTCEGWEDDDTIPAVFSATAVSPRLYRLEFHTGPETYTQDIYADTMPEALTFALETIRTITYWEQSPDSMHLSEIEEI